MFLYSNFNIKQDKQITFLNVIELISKLLPDSCPWRERQSSW